MEPISFKGSNVVIGEDQPQYRSLPALVAGDGFVISCWSLSDEEIEIIKKQRCIYLRQYTARQPLQPVLLTTDLSEGINLTMD